MPDLVPGELGKVHEPVGPTQIDERAKLGEARDPSAAFLAFVQLG